MFKLGKNIKQAQISYNFTTTNPISNNNDIALEFVGSFQFTVMTQGTLCKLYYEDSNGILKNGE